MLFLKVKCLTDVYLTSRPTRSWTTASTLATRLYPQLPITVSMVVVPAYIALLHAD